MKILVLEGVIRLILVGLQEIIFKKVPDRIFGHHDFEAFPEMLLRIIKMFNIAWWTMGFTDWLRFKLYTQQAPSQKSKTKGE